MLEGVKASNGKISWDSLQEPKKTDNELFEDLVYQSSMFDTECPATATSRSIRNVDNDLDKLDELFAKATEDEISKKP